MLIFYIKLPNQSEVNKLPKKFGTSTMTVTEAGRKGGKVTASTHGREFYEEIGRKGGETTAATHGKEFYEEIGRIGGEKARQKVSRLVEEGRKKDKNKKDKSKNKK